MKVIGGKRKERKRRWDRERRHPEILLGRKLYNWGGEKKRWGRGREGA